MKFSTPLLLGCAVFVLGVVTGLTAVAEDAKREEPVKTTSAVVIAQCGRVIGLVIVDSNGKLHPVPPEAMSDKVLGETMAQVGESYVVAQTPCSAQRSGSVAL